MSNEQPVVFVRQNVDRTITAKDYNHLQPNQLLVHNTFTTIQGEGPLVGRRSLFVRLAGCNYGAKAYGICEWCDTAFHFDNGKPTYFHELEEEANVGLHDLMVITGGEPLIQRNLSKFIEFVQGDTRLHVQIETNGSQVSTMRELLANHDSDKLDIVCSPKYSHKGPGDLTRLYDLLTYDNFYLKFVVSADADSHSWVPAPTDHELLDQYSHRVFLSPMAVYAKPYAGEVSNAWDHTLVDPQRTSRNYHRAAQLCMDMGYRLSIQQHLFCAVA